jgi:hypothetical protein
MRDLSTIITLIALIALPQTNSIKKCPIECTCDLDASGRYSAICERGNENFMMTKLFIDFHIKPTIFLLFFVS